MPSQRPALSLVLLHNRSNPIFWTRILSARTLMLWIHRSRSQHWTQWSVRVSRDTYVFLLYVFACSCSSVLMTFTPLSPPPHQGFFNLPMQFMNLMGSNTEASLQAFAILNSSDPLPSGSPAAAANSACSLDKQASAEPSEDGDDNNSSSREEDEHEEDNNKDAGAAIKAPALGLKSVLQEQASKAPPIGCKGQYPTSTPTPEAECTPQISRKPDPQPQLSPHPNYGHVIHVHFAYLPSGIPIFGEPVAQVCVPYPGCNPEAVMMAADNARCQGPAREPGEGNDKEPAPVPTGSTNKRSSGWMSSDNDADDTSTKLVIRNEPMNQSILPFPPRCLSALLILDRPQRIQAILLTNLRWILSKTPSWTRSQRGSTWSCDSSSSTAPAAAPHRRCPRPRPEIRPREYCGLRLPTHICDAQFCRPFHCCEKVHITYCKNFWTRRLRE